MRPTIQVVVDHHAKLCVRLIFRFCVQTRLHLHISHVPFVFCMEFNRPLWQRFKLQWHTRRQPSAQTHCHDVRKTRHIKNQPPEPPQDGRVHLYVCVRNGGTCSWFGRIQISISNVYLRSDYLCIVCCLCVDLHFECTERRHGVVWAQCCFSITIVQSANAVVGLFGVGCGMALFRIGLRKLVPNGVQQPSSLACCMRWCLRLYLCLWLCSCLSLGP